MMVLKEVTIGDNVFVWAGSVVTKDIPANSIAVGVPCKVVMSLDDYYEKRTKVLLKEAFEYAKSIRERYNRKPKEEDFWEEFPLFISGSDIDMYHMIPIKKQLGSSFDRFVQKHKAPYKGFDDFLRVAEVES